MRMALFEDRHASDFHPLTLLRPVFELCCGHYSLRERLLRQLGVSSWGAFVRDPLAATYREQHPEAAVNDVDWLRQEPTLLINGRWLPVPADLKSIHPDEVGVVDGRAVYLTLDPSETVLLGDSDWGEMLDRIGQMRPRRVAASGKLLTRPWDLINHNPEQIALDFSSRWFPATPAAPRPDVALIGPAETIHIDPTAQLDPYVVIDARQGPVSIEAGAVIQSFTRIEGPCHVGLESRLFRANVRGGTTIGPNCRVGGEIEASILQEFVNKYHDGFLGHSYVSPWVNLGAETTNSDLKNDYSPVSVPLSGESVKTGCMKVGCFIGDFTKTGIGSLFNTGSSIGVMCLVLPDGELLPKFVPSFASVRRGVITPGLSVERNLVAARIAMERRNTELTPTLVRLLKHVYQQTRAEHDAAVERSRATSREWSPR